MGTKRVSITDIAKKTGVSAGSVHRALAGKPGVSEKTRAYILEAAKEMGYQPNYIASSLKRRTLRILAAFPAYTSYNRFFFPYVWQGFRDCIADMADYNIEAVELPYAMDPGPGSQRQELLEAFDRYEGGVDGLLTIGHINNRDLCAVKRYTDAGIPVILACDDKKSLDRLCCVQADHFCCGSLAAELLSMQIPAGSQVLVCAGDTLVPSHYETLEAFEGYLREHGCNMELIKVHGRDLDTGTYDRVMEKLREYPGIRGAYSVNATNGIVLCNAVTKMKREREISVILSDVYPENIENFKKGIVNSIVYKNPYQQGYLATKAMIDYLVKNETPISDVIHVRSEVVLRSNLHLYEETGL